MRSLVPLLGLSLLLVLVMGTDAKAVSRKAGATKDVPKNKKGLRPAMFENSQCGRNSTCRAISRECKKLQMASMIGDKLAESDLELVTTKDKLEELAKVMKESKQNFTDCLKTLGVEAPTKETKPMKLQLGGAKQSKHDFGLAADKATQVRKCMISKAEMLNDDDSLNRSALKSKMTSGYNSLPDVQAAVEEAIDTCPEPENYRIHEFIACVNQACIDNIVIDNEE